MLFTGAFMSGSFAAEPDLEEDVLMRALADELERSMSLKLEGLDGPYLIQYFAEDEVVHSIYADAGAVFRSDESHSRVLSAQVRVGSYDLDNTNLPGGGGFRGGRSRGGGGQRNLTRTSLPVEDDYLAIRHATWLATDQNYKQAVEAMSRKRAYLAERNVEERPADFTKASTVRIVEPKAAFAFERAEWESKLRELSEHMRKQFSPQDMSISMIVTVQNRYLVNSEGTRMRTGQIGTVLNVNVEIQAEDGERLSDSRSYYVPAPSDLPAVESLKSELAKMGNQLESTLKTPVLENYTGPILFEGLAAAQMFQQLLAGGLTGSPEPIGGQQRSSGGSRNLDTYVGRRILPRSFQVYDSPQTDLYSDVFLAGRYQYDDEGIESQRVDLVKDGVLQGMVMSRTPTKKFSKSTGHGRGTGIGGAPSAQIGSLHIESDDGVPLAELKQNLLEEADAQGLKFALRITALGTGATGNAKHGEAFFGRGGRGPGASLPDPLYVYKVYVEDGREELARGCQFSQITLRSLRDIIAASETVEAYNQISPTGFSPPSSIIAPSVIFEELDLTKVEIERDKKPVLKAPETRQP